MMSKFCLWLCLVILSLGIVTGSAQKVGIYELKKGDFSMKVTNYGARIVSVVLPDKHGKLGDIVLGYDTAKEYLNDTRNFGALVGRVANRISNAHFTLNGVRYNLTANGGNGNYTIHGGEKGFGKVIWKVKRIQRSGHSPYITLSYFSADGEEGFPGALQVTVTYALLGHYKMGVTMKAKALNNATPVNLAQHAYWNLGGHDSGDILSDELQIFASNITAVDERLIPTGEIVPVKGTPYDFLKPRKISSLIGELPRGYDTNFCIDGYEADNNVVMNPIAFVRSEKSGREMKLFSNAPGVQLYTANNLKGDKGKGGYVYQPYAALCLETQGFPDSVNQPHFPSQIVNKGETYSHHMLFIFSA